MYVAVFFAYFSPLHFFQVMLLVGENYTAKYIEYHKEKSFGHEGQAGSRTLLCFMMKSAAGKCRDVASLSPVVNLTANFLKKRTWNRL